MVLFFAAQRIVFLLLCSLWSWVNHVNSVKFIFGPDKLGHKFVIKIKWENAHEIAYGK